VGTSALTAGRIGKIAERIDASPGEMIGLPRLERLGVFPGQDLEGWFVGR
jgi:hypothetical protein